MARSRARRVTMFGLAIGMFALAAGGAVGAVFRDPPVKTSTTTTAPSTTTTLPPVANLGDVGKELGTLVAAGRKVDYAAVYTVTDPTLTGGVQQSIEVWRKGELFRSDIVETRPGASVHRTSTITGGAVARSCETVNGRQTCKSLTGTGSDLPEAFIRNVVTAPTPPKLTVKDDAVAGYQARCFAAPKIGGLCLAGDGTMLRLVLEEPKGTLTVELKTISSDVPSSAFVTSASSG